jgi:hypothetical protein
LKNRSVTLWSALVLGSAVLLFAASPAAADFDFCPLGEGAGECGLAPFQNSLRGLAIDHETNRLYVADRPNNRVEVFTESGEFRLGFGWGVADGTTAALQTCGPDATPPTAQCFKGIAGSGLGQFGTTAPPAKNGPTKVAVDNNPASASHHDVYVVDEGNHRIEKFSPTGAFIWTVGSEGEGEGQFKSFISADIGPGGVLYLLDNLSLGSGVKFKHRLQRLDPITHEAVVPQCILREGGAARDIGVAADGSFWVPNVLEANGVRKYDTGCAELLVRDSGIESNALALDETGRVFVEQHEERDKAALGAFQTIMARDGAGEAISRFGYGRIPPWRPEGLAVRSAGGVGGIFLAFGEIVENEAGIRRLDYTGAGAPVLPPPGPIAAPPSLEVGKVGSTKATLGAEVNPEGKETHVHFEYVTEAAYEADVGGGGDGFEGPGTESSPDQILGASGFRLKSIEEQIGCPDPATEVGQPGNDCLATETKYHWRVVATNAGGPGEGTVEGTPFTTPRAPELGAIYSTEVGTDTARLNAEVNPLSIPATGYFEYVDDAHFQESEFENATKVPDVEAGQAPLDFGAGEKFATRSVTLYPLAPGTTYHYRLIATNSLIKPVAFTSGAETLRTFEPPAPRPCANDGARIGPGGLLPDCRAYELVSPLDKEGGDIRVLKDEFQQLTVLEQSADSGEELAYGSARSFGGALSGPATSQYIARRVAGSAWESHPINPPRGRPLGGAAGQIHSEFKAFSADLCDAWVATFAEMPEAPAGFVPGVQNLLRRHDRLCGAEGFEALAPIAIPQGVPADSGFVVELLGTSADGRHAIFTANGKLAAGGSKGPRQLYESVEGAAPRFVCFLPGGTPFGGACTAGTRAPNGQTRALPGAISADGQRIFWSAGGAGPQPLYVRIGGTETVAVSQAAEVAEGTSGESEFWGAASDGSEAVFTTGNLTSGPAPALYSFEVDGKTSTKIAEGVLGVLGISADAKRIYFASKKDLAAGASEGKPNLYLYEAGGGTSFIATLAGADLLEATSDERYGERTARVTPDGGHAVFASVASLIDYDNKGAQGGNATREIYRYDAGAKKLVCVSCNPSRARPVGPSSIPSLSSPMHAARVISEDGSRVYFESADRLAARDTNGKVDVYQWEEEGGEGCGEADSDFAPAAQGCVELISSGQGPQDSRLVESSPDGRDVFFATISSLLPQDYGLFDIYDARVGGGLPIPPPRVPPCEGDACHNSPGAPEAPRPASSEYVGPPKAKSPSAKPRCAKGKRRVTRKGKSRCLPKREKQRHHRRAGR